MMIVGPRATLLVGALVLSVCLNALAVGILAGDWFARDMASETGPSWEGRRDGGPRHPVGFGIDFYLHAAPAEARPYLREGMEALKDELRARLRAVGDARREMSAALKTEPYDPARFDAALAALRQRSSEVQAVTHAGLSAAAARMPQDVRVTYADSMLRRRTKPGSVSETAPGRGPAANEYAGGK